MLPSHQRSTRWEKTQSNSGVSPVDCPHHCRCWIDTVCVNEKTLDFTARLQSYLSDAFQLQYRALFAGRKRTFRPQCCQCRHGSRSQVMTALAVKQQVQDCCENSTTSRVMLVIDTSETDLVNRSTTVSIAGFVSSRHSSFGHNLLYPRKNTAKHDPAR